MAVAAFLSVTLAAAAARPEEPRVSILPLITQLQHEHGNLQPVHPQPQKHWMRKLVESSSSSLSLDNTRPIRIRVDSNSMVRSRLEGDEFLRHTACFTPGEFFRRGLPDNQPTPPSVPTCARGAGESLSTDGCWGTCLESDLIADADRQKIHEVLEVLAAEVSNLLSVVPEAELTFSRSRGTYWSVLSAKGYTPRTGCAEDCRVLSGVAVDDGYCDQGLGHGYDVILSVTKPPGIAGVAGTGSSCGANGAGKPLWIVLAWHSSIVGVAGTATSTLVDRYRGFVIHEILHGLGFVNSQFNYARDSSGARKHLIELRPVFGHDFYLRWSAVGTSTPSTGSPLSSAPLAAALGGGQQTFTQAEWDALGVASVRDDSYVSAGGTFYRPRPTDEVWFFVRGRAYELAQLYFACDGNVSGADKSWDGLPLMGLPEAGRGAHWETLIMRDDVMSYGFHDIVSSITLAAMEDLGFYLANYSAAGCMNWGLRQGCEFVRRRCGVQIHDQPGAFVVNDGNGRDACSGDPHWDTPDAYLAAQCDRGINPCDSAADANFALAVSCPADAGLPPGQTCSRCDSQCARQPIGGRADCALSPSTQPEQTSGSVLDNLRSRLNSIDWQAWLIPLIYLLGFILVFSIVQKCICPSGDRARTIAYALLVVVFVLAALMVAGTGILLHRREMYEAFIGLNTIAVCAAIGVFLLFFTLFQAYALCTHHEFFLRLGFWVLLVMCLLQVLASLLVCYWVYSLGAIPSDTLNSLFGDTRQNIDSFLGNVLEEPVSVAEGLVCMTYQKCCRDPALDQMLVADDLPGGQVGSGDAASGDGSGEAASGGGRVIPHAANVSRATCLEPGMHSSLNDLDAALHDPSNDNFCAYTSGAPRHLLNEPPGGICNLIEMVQSYSGGSWSRAQCQSDFCPEGTDGYLAFVTMFVELLQRYAWPLGTGLAVLVLIEMVLAFNLRTAAKNDRKRRQEGSVVKQLKWQPSYTNNV